MGLQRFEQGLERLVEGTFAKVFRSGLQPVELGRRVAREMDLRRSLGVNGTVAPNHFEIMLSESDDERFASFSDALKRELVESARGHAREERYTFLGPLGIDIATDSALTAGIFVVKGTVREGPGGAPVGNLALGDGRRVGLSEKPIAIGRMPDCDIALTDPNVSRHHAEVRPSGNEYVVVDVGSTNGTKVNGAWITGERRLHDGDEIIVGATVIRFERS